MRDREESRMTRREMEERGGTYVVLIREGDEAGGDPLRLEDVEHGQAL